MFSPSFYVKLQCGCLRIFYSHARFRIVIIKNVIFSPSLPGDMYTVRSEYSITSSNNIGSRIPSHYRFLGHHIIIVQYIITKPPYVYSAKRELCADVQYTYIGTSRCEHYWNNRVAFIIRIYTDVLTAAARMELFFILFFYSFSTRTISQYVVVAARAHVPGLIRYVYRRLYTHIHIHIYIFLIGEVYRKIVKCGIRLANTATRTHLFICLFIYTHARLLL